MATLRSDLLELLEDAPSWMTVEELTEDAKVYPLTYGGAMRLELQVAEVDRELHELVKEYRVVLTSDGRWRIRHEPPAKAQAKPSPQKTLF